MPHANTIRRWTARNGEGRVRDLKVVKWLVSFFVANIRAYVVR
jgi:hypothetical protein